MTRFLMPATAMTTLKKVAFTLFCGVACGLVSLVLMVSAAMAQVAGGPPNPSSGPAAPLPASGANDPIIGLPATANYGNCFPFGCAYNGHYQQVYTSSQFSGPVTITELYFYNTVYNNSATAMNSGTWTISLSTTSANWNSLSSTFSANIGADNTQVFSGNLAQSWAFGDTLAIVLTTPFTYNPSLGNLLMTVVATGTTAPGGLIFFDSNTANAIMGRVYCSETEGAGVDCGPTGNVDSGFGLVTGYTAVVTQETLTVNLLDSGTGTVTDNNEAPTINCSEASGTVTGTCSASYPAGTVVTLTATVGSGSTFAGWGGACSSFGTNTTCTVTMNSAQNVTASFDIPNQTVTKTVTTDTPATFNYNGGYAGGGTDYIAQLTSGPSVTSSVTEITFASQTACNSIFTNTPFAGAQCFVAQNGGTGTAAVGYELTCPGYSGTNGTCGSDANPNFFATLGSDFSFNIGDNPGLGLVGTPPNETLTYNGGNPLVSILKYVGPDPLHPCTLNPNSPPVSLSNQTSSFTFVDPGSKPIQGGSGGTGSCWMLLFGTPGEAPSVTVAAPVNNGVYLQNLNDPTTKANYTCDTVYNGVNTPTGGIYPPYTATGPYLTGTCSATDTPGGSVGQGAQFDTATPGPHTFTATVLDSATNTASQTVTYYVQGNSSTGVTSNANPSHYGQSVTFTAAVTGVGTPTGTVQFAIDGSSFGPPVTLSGGSASSGSISTLTVGTHIVTAAYSGDSSNGTSTGTLSGGQVVNPASQTITFTTSAPTSAAYNSSFTVAATGGASGNPVTFTSSGVCSITGTTPGTATYLMTNSTGTCSVIANQAGTTNYSAAPQVTQTVNATGPLLSLTPTTINFGNVYLFNIAVQTLTLKNTGNATLHISGVSLTFGQADQDFGFVNLCPASLAPGKSCIIFLGFWADQLGTQTGTLVITDNAPGSPQQVAITGNGIKKH